MNNFYLLIIALVLCSGKLYSKNSKLEFQEYDLENGIHVILAPDNSRDSVILSCAYRVGLSYENKRTNSYSEILSKIGFLGTENLSVYDYKHKLIMKNIDYDSSVGREFSLYRYKMKSSGLELCLKYEAERLKIPTISEDKLKRLFDKEINRIELGVDYNKYSKLFSKINSEYDRLYRIKRNGIKYNYDEFIGFFMRYYIPQNLVLTICGNFDIDEIKKIIESYYSELIPGKSRSKLKKIKLKRMPFEQKRDTIYDNVGLLSYAKIHVLPGVKAKDYLEYEIVSSFYSGYSYSQIVNSQIDLFVRCPKNYHHNFYSQAYCTMLSQIEKTKMINDEGVVKIMRYDYQIDTTASNFERAYDKFQGLYKNFNFEKQSLSYICEQLWKSYLLFEDTEMINKRVEMCRKLDKRKLLKFESKYQKFNKSRLSIIYPKRGFIID
ncbi:MAG: insulinase family protein [Marinifilaceae bacterium]|jgi:predicted Zn-dependent peptidase|nr:insulinase family protein [Marinifilaceae bacterium]